MKVIVTKPGRRCIIVVDDDNRMLALLETFSMKIPSGVYEDPYDIVNIFHKMASRGHDTRTEPDPSVAYNVIRQILTSDLPMDEKITQIIKYLRAVRG